MTIGCSSEPETFLVTGSVTYKGKPLPYGTVRFLPNGSSPIASSAISPDGTYSVEVIAAEHRVTVFAVPTAESDPNAWMYEGGVKPGAKSSGPSVPGYYSDVGTTPFRCEVSGDGEVTFDISIPVKKQKKRKRR